MHSSCYTCGKRQDACAHDKTPAAGTPNPTGRGDYLTSAQLSERLNIPAEQLSKWRQRREGPPYYRITRQHVRYNIAELETWLATKRIPA